MSPEPRARFAPTTRLSDWLAADPSLTGRRTEPDATVSGSVAFDWIEQSAPW